MKIAGEKMRTLDQALWIPAAMLAAVFMLAGTQAAWGDDIRLKDGSLIKGQVIKEVPGQNYTVRRADGSEQVVPADQVESLQRSAVSEPTRSANRRTVLEQEPSRFRKGLSIGLGLGASLPVKKDYYLSDGVIFYPELRIQSDLGPLEIGLSGGLVYGERSLLESDRFMNYAQIYVPLELHVNILPVRFFAPRFPVQPYIGSGLGGYIAVGDNDDSHFMISPTVGLEFYIGDHNIIGLDYSYHYIGAGGGAESGNLSYNTIMLCYRFRFPLGQR